MNNDIKKNYIPVISLLVLFICFLYAVYSVLYKGGTILYGDSLFHVQRIMEIRYAFSQHELPNWLNFQTFLGIGQAINGMYPDISLWPFVALTMPLSITHQVLAINLMILLLTFIVSSLSIKYQLKADPLTAIYMSIAYTFSGYSLYQFIDEFQPGAGIILIFSFPIAFMIRNIVFSNRIDLSLIVRFALMITLILYSHLLSIVVLAIIMASIICYAIICHKFKYQSLINMIIGGIIAIIPALPIIYRYLYISRSGIIQPFGQGTIKAASVTQMFNSASSWDSRISLSALSILCILIVLTFWNRKFSRDNIKLLIGEFWLLVLCTTIFPWVIFNKVPLVNNLQFTPWRFGIWTSIIPIILLLINFQDQKNSRRKIGFILAVVSLFMSCQVVNNISSSGYLRFNDYNAKILASIKSNYDVSSNTILRYVAKIDYYPQAKRVMNKDEYLTSARKNLLYNQRLQAGGHFYPIKKEAINNGSLLKVKRSINIHGSNIQLPLLGYKSLDYDIEINNYPVNYGINEYGYIYLYNVSLHKGDIIKVTYNNPRMYYLSVFIAMVSLILLLMFLVVNHFKSMKASGLIKAS